MIEIQYPVHLPNQGFSSNTEAISFDKNCLKDVVTLGREKGTHALVVNTGKIVPKSSSFNCEELLVSTCRISKVCMKYICFDMIFFPHKGLARISLLKKAMKLHAFI